MGPHSFDHEQGTLAVVPTCDAGNKAVLAFAVQGSNDSLHNWINMLRLSHASDAVSFFLLSYQAPLQCATYASLDLHCGYGPGTSWGEGRNRLGRMIYRCKLTSVPSQKCHVLCIANAHHHLLISFANFWQPKVQDASPIG